MPRNSKVTPMADQAGERRQLTENVVRLFTEDRPAILNRKWRGSCPSNVIDMRARWHWASAYFKPGDEAMICSHYDERGNRVRILKYTSPETRERLHLGGRPDCWLHAELIGWALTREGGIQVQRAIFASKELQRIR